MKYLITLSLVLLMVGIVGGDESVNRGYWTYPSDRIEAQNDTISIDEGTFGVDDFDIGTISFGNGVSIGWEIIMPYNCKDCIEVKYGKVVVRIWPDGTVKECWQADMWLNMIPTSFPVWVPIEPDDYTWPPNQGMRQ